MDADGACGRTALEVDGEVVWSWRLDAGVKSAEATPLATVTNKPITGESTKETVKTIAQGMPGESGVTVVTMLVCFFHIAREAAGAAGARHSLRPLTGEGGRFRAELARNARRDREAVSVNHCLKIKSVAIY